MKILGLNFLIKLWNRVIYLFSCSGYFIVIRVYLLLSATYLCLSSSFIFPYSVYLRPKLTFLYLILRLCVSTKILIWIRDKIVKNNWAVLRVNLIEKHYCMLPTTKILRYLNYCVCGFLSKFNVKTRTNNEHINSIYITRI